jgi:hypothetical protein
MFLSSASKDPLANNISSMSWSTNSNYQSFGLKNSSLMSYLFDTDNKFQKFILFTIDYAFIINEHIINNPSTDNTYDLNDELSIFTFNLLINILSIGLVSIN